MSTDPEWTRRVHEFEHFEIELSDGCRLAARAWMPTDADTWPCPAILEYIPYRKNDATLPRDERMHPAVAAHGYACVRVDLRGSGESDGVLRDEYTQQELDDGVEVIAWLAQQSWCDGGVGMIGISWGGFNGLQIAAMNPPALKAVITCCSTDDRYADDVHYMGGCLLGDNLSWASHMFARNSLPPDPRHVGGRWRELWFQRLQQTGLWLETWLAHQHRDAYWRHGSVCEDFSRIRCPVYAVSGWADGYCNAVFRLLAGLDVPRKGLVGPWAHQYPHMARPGPGIDFVGECVRWWDHWLGGRDTGVMNEPMLHVWMQDSAPPCGDPDTRPGRWVSAPAWPAPEVSTRRLYPDGDGDLVGASPAQPAALTLSSPLSTGLAAGKWCSYAVPGDQPVDQRSDDARSLTFDTAALDEPLEILGAAVAELEIEVDRPVAMLAVRLCEVAPGGASTRVSYGVLNLTHRDGHAEPTPLTPGERYRVRVPLKHVAQRVAAGHRLRLAVSTCYWPLTWPSPEPVTLTLHTSGSQLELPAREPSTADAGTCAFAPPPPAPPTRAAQIEPAELGWSVLHDLGKEEHVLAVDDGHGVFRLEDTGLVVRRTGQEHYTASDRDWGSARAHTRWTVGLARESWSITTVTETELTADERMFHIHASLKAYEDGVLCHEQTWQRSVPRDLV